MNKITVLAGGLSAVIAVMPAYAQSVDNQNRTDWPTVIDRLRQDVQQRPGLASPRQQLAVALNNYGVQLADQQDWDHAKQQFEEAMRFDSANVQFAKNLASVYLTEAQHDYQGRRNKEALASLERVLALDPTLAQAHALLGNLEYDDQQLTKAKAAWEKAIELDPQLTDVQERLKQVSEELPIESKFERLSQAYFDLRYEEQLERPLGFDIRDALLEARGAVGSDFTYWPKYKIVVLIYSAQSFRTLRAETPEWVGGQYDGKIRVPLPNGQLDAAAVKQIIFHEYTHALVRDLTLGKCPVWLNEGLAEYEGAKVGSRRFDQLSDAMRKGRLVAWRELEQQFSTALPVDTVALGYQESHSVIRFLVDRYGFWRIRRVLKAVASGAPLEEALTQEFHLQASRLEANWRLWLPELFGSTS